MLADLSASGLRWRSVARHPGPGRRRALGDRQRCAALRRAVALRDVAPGPVSAVHHVSLRMAQAHACRVTSFSGQCRGKSGVEGIGQKPDSIAGKRFGNEAMGRKQVGIGRVGDGDLYRCD